MRFEGCIPLFWKPSPVRLTLLEAQIPLPGQERDLGEGHIWEWFLGCCDENEMLPVVNPLLTR